MWRFREIMLWFWPQLCRCGIGFQSTSPVTGTARSREHCCVSPTARAVGRPAASLRLAINRPTTRARCGIRSAGRCRVVRFAWPATSTARRTCVRWIRTGGSTIWRWTGRLSRRRRRGRGNGREAGVWAGMRWTSVTKLSTARWQPPVSVPSAWSGRSGDDISRWCSMGDAINQQECRQRHSWAVIMNRRRAEHLA